MKQISAIFTAVLALFLVSCNNQPKPDTTATPAKTAPAFTPYNGMIVQHEVQDYDKWFAVFTASDSMRTAYGMSHSAVGRGLDDDKAVVVFNMISDVQKAHDFAASPGLAEAMKNAGVSSAPTLSYLHVIFDDTSSIPQKERLMVTHHVKDFDAWKKAFDAEGMATRASYGLVDRALARGIDDPNTVCILFAVTDMAKAKARADSPELKKVMSDAGVDGPPQITWFKWVTN